MNASVYRKTKFELRLLQQGPNSFGIICSERGVLGEVPPLEIPEEDFTDEEMSQVHAVLQMLEEKFAAVYDKHMSDPVKLREMLAKSMKVEAAQKAELQRIKKDGIVQPNHVQSGLITLK